MEQNLDKKVQQVMDYVKSKGIQTELKIFEQTAKTAQAAADLLGIKTEQIANSLVFQNEENDELILFITSGGHRVDLNYIQKNLGLKLTRANPNLIKQKTGFVIGGIPPVAHKTPLTTYLDKTLLKHDTIWAAAGIAESVFSLNSHLLDELTEGQWIEVKATN